MKFPNRHYLLLVEFLLHLKHLHHQNLRHHLQQYQQQLLRNHYRLHYLDLREMLRHLKKGESQDHHHRLNHLLRLKVHLHHHHPLLVVNNR